MFSPQYLAGFFDGEGCVNISQAGKTKQVTLRVMVANTNQEILVIMQSQHGGSLAKPRTLKVGWKPFRLWKLNGIEAINFLRLIRPYTYIKNAQIDLALEFWAFMHEPNRCEFVYTPSGHAIRQRTSETLTKELAYKAQMHQLNAKGVN